MAWFPFGRSKTASETRSSIENPTVPVSAENFFAFFGMDTANLPSVTIDSALRVPAVNAAVNFLSRTLAALPLHAYRETADGAVKLTGKTAVAIHDAPNPVMGSFKFRQYFWQQVFTGGRGLAWIEKNGSVVEAFWPMDPTRTTIQRRGFELVYKFENKTYSSAEVIDVPFMLKANQVQHFGPVGLAAKAIQLALAMNDYGATFFAGGGVPPLSLTGPLGSGPDATKRSVTDVNRAISAAKESRVPIFPIPPGYKLEPVGFDPEKGQMTDARLFQVQEIARAWQMPPVFLQDLSKGTFANVEQQDLHLVKHLIGQWAKAFEDEANLKVFGRPRGNRYLKHNLDALMRGDFKSRIEGIARAVQTAQMTPNEGRALEERPRHANPAADELLVQGATVVLGSQPAGALKSEDTPPKRDDDGDKDDDNAGK